MIILLPQKKIVVQDEWLSPIYCKHLKENFNLPSEKTTKLIPTLKKKKKNKYVLQIRNLQLYFLLLDLGMKITKMYRFFNLINPHWLKKYINFNTEKKK